MNESSPVTILLAEDDAGHASLIQRNLKRSGFVNEIVHVSDGQEALDYLRLQGKYADRRPDGPLLIVLDINMPRVDGMEVLRMVKSEATTAKIPVIMLTTTDDPREIERSYELGCNVYITKPVAYERFVEALQRVGLFLQVVTVLREDEARRE
ncbi:MAG TPA: response regulator [Pirellulaceae bacterium]|nr:response regulator [Pirellulaceae bacterium]